MLTCSDDGVQVYYTTPSKKSEGVKGYWCHPCYNEHRGEVIELEGMRVRKVRKRRPDLCLLLDSSLRYPKFLTESVGLSASAPMGLHVLAVPMDPASSKQRNAE